MKNSEWIREQDKVGEIAKVITIKIVKKARISGGA